MIYLTNNDLKDHAFERLINESKNDYLNSIDDLELENIMLIKTYLGNRYDVMTIFDETNPIRNQLIKRILAKMLLYDLVRRNAARKVPSDYKDSYDWAIDMLEKIAHGEFVIKDFPKAVDENGNLAKPLLYGNNRNENFYI